MGFALIHDPNNLIMWENGADIQGMMSGEVLYSNKSCYFFTVLTLSFCLRLFPVTYKIPDDTWQDYRDLRVLTGRDFDVEGLAVINQTCAVIGDEFMPALFMVDPSTGVVLSPFVRTPDINQDGSLSTDVFFTSRRDKVHCPIPELEAGECTSVDSSVVDEQDVYRKHDPSGGYEGFSLLADGTIAAFLEKNSGDTTLSDEPGVRVYHVIPGDCSVGSEPVFDSFMGFYAFEHGAGNIADVSTIPGSSQYVAVIERNGFPGGHLFPGSGMPANKVCVVDLTSTDENMVFDKKKCVLNYHSIQDPWDVDGNGIFVYGHTQVTNEALIVVDDYCMVAGTDTNYPWTNQFQLDELEVPDWQETRDARFMVVCFVEPIFAPDMVAQYVMNDMMMSDGSTGMDNSGSGSDIRTPDDIPEDPEEEVVVQSQQESAGAVGLSGGNIGVMVGLMVAAIMLWM